MIYQASIVSDRPIVWGGHSCPPPLKLVSLFPILQVLRSQIWGNSLKQSSLNHFCLTIVAGRKSRVRSSRQGHSRPAILCVR
jgi:hypothetical protein